MSTGPRPSRGFDLSVTELSPDDAEGHRFVVDVGSEAGAEIVDALGLAEADDGDVETADALSEQAATRMGRELDTTDIRDLLYEAVEHPRFDEVAERCLTCTNCTLVCPTCFCSRVDDVTSLDGQTAERVRSWDSCFSLEYSYIHGGHARTSVMARYRHWLTHKLASWHDQFGSSGCVGCGRCITWCPAGIDITEEVAAMREQPTPPRSKRI
jgi:ferredoxin